ncbi:DUF2442 domain-containing protein [Leptolyngbya sp. DQ-M1]|uniref:DUF2442 domain-containing protein n=1 Tax=Leptolyngbya sp. DQ-M1 TaxID=2933920 RepID=UPI00329A3A48
MAQKKWRNEISEAELESQITQAKAAWVQAASTEPCAESVKFYPRKLQYTIALTNAAQFSFPVSLLRELAEASIEELSDVHLSGDGGSIHWEILDVDFSISGLVTRILGTKLSMIELGRQGGKKRTIAKSEAARQNGKKGGRPRKETQEEPRGHVKPQLTK